MIPIPTTLKSTGSRECKHSSHFQIECYEIFKDFNIFSKGMKPLGLLHFKKNMGK